MYFINILENNLSIIKSPKYLSTVESQNICLPNREKKKIIEMNIFPAFPRTVVVKCGKSAGRRKIHETSGNV